MSAAGTAITALKPVRQLTEMDMAALDTLKAITLGMGWFFSLKRVLAVLVSIMLFNRRSAI